MEWWTSLCRGQVAIQQNLSNCCLTPTLLLFPSQIILVSLKSSLPSSRNKLMEAHSSSSSDGGLSVRRALQLIQSDDQALKLQGAQEIRRLTKTSQRCRRQLSGSVGSLVSMLRVHDSPQSHQSALLALLNLAVKDETYVFFFFSLSLKE